MFIVIHLLVYRFTNENRMLNNDGFRIPAIFYNNPIELSASDHADLLKILHQNDSSEIARGQLALHGKQL